MDKDAKVGLATLRSVDSRAVLEKGMGTSLMSTASASRSHAHETVNVEADVDAGTQSVVVVHECTRIGRTANPPFSFLDWFRIGRRRR